MKRLIFEEYKRDGFSNAQISVLTYFSKRLNKLYLSPSTGQVEVAQTCNEVTAWFLDFMDNVTPDSFFQMPTDFYNQFYEKLMKLSPIVLLTLQAATEFPFLIYIENMTHEKRFEEWTEEFFFTPNPLEDVEEEVVRNTVESSFLSFFQLEEDMLDREKNGPEVFDLEGFKQKAQKELDETSLGLLVVPGYIINKKRLYPKIIERVLHHNNKIAKITGWGKEAMGLKGRVFLMLGCVHGYRYSGLFSRIMNINDLIPNVPLCVKTTSSSTNYRMEEEEELNCIFRALNHEWLHALDSLSYEREKEDYIDNIRGSLFKFNEQLNLFNMSSDITNNISHHYYKSAALNIHDIMWKYYKSFKVKDAADIVMKLSISMDWDDKEIFAELQNFELLSNYEMHICHQYLWIASAVDKGIVSSFPFLERDEGFDLIDSSLGCKEYYRLEGERLAYSFENSLNWDNAINYLEMAAASREESAILKERWSLLFKKHVDDFNNLSSVSNTENKAV